MVSSPHPRVHKPREFNMVPNPSFQENAVKAVPSDIVTLVHRKFYDQLNTQYYRIGIGWRVSDHMDRRSASGHLISVACFFHRTSPNYPAGLRRDV
jgi:hypothetical protein